MKSFLCDHDLHSIDYGRICVCLLAPLKIRPPDASGVICPALRQNMYECALNGY